MNNDLMLVPRDLLQRFRERLDCHIDARDWGLVCNILLAAPAAQAVDEDSERVAFEDWADRNWPGAQRKMLERDDCGAYKSSIYRDYWTGWISRAALAAPVQSDAPYPDGVAELLERNDWTPENALRFYAEGKHFDAVNGRTRIIDTGAVASNALKHASLPYLEMKGDAELTELREAVQSEQEPVAWISFGPSPIPSEGEIQQVWSSQKAAEKHIAGVDGWRVAPLYRAAPVRAVRLPDPISAFAIEIINGSYEGGGLDACNIQDMAVRHGLLSIEERDEPCRPEGCACAEYGFPSECYRHTDAMKDAVARLNQSSNQKEITE